MEGEMWEMNFHVADATRPLAPAMALAKLGHRIVMGPCGSYVENLRTGDRVTLRDSAGAFVFDIDCAKTSTVSGRG